LPQRPRRSIKLYCIDTGCQCLKLFSPPLMKRHNKLDRVSLASLCNLIYDLKVMQEHTQVKYLLCVPTNVELTWKYGTWLLKLAIDKTSNVFGLDVSDKKTF
jgi:hypothetical protein